MSLEEQRRLISKFANLYPDTVHGQDENGDYIFSIETLEKLKKLSDSTFSEIYHMRHGVKRKLLIEKVGHPADGTKDKMIKQWNQMLSSKNSLFYYEN